MVTEGGLVPERFAGVDLVTMPPLYDNPVYRIPVPLRLAYNKAAVAIGVARGALDEFAELANAKTPMLSSTPLRDRPIAQHRMGEGEATLRAARAFLFEAMGQVEDELWAGREAPSAERTQIARLACTHAANASMQVVDSIHNAGGHVGDADGQPARTQAARRARLRDPPLGRPSAVRRDSARSSSATRRPPSSPAPAGRPRTRALNVGLVRVTGLTETELQSLVGHRFAGGRYRIEHWENWLLTDCTGRDPLPDGLVHPIVLFHVPILGVGTSITELFELGWRVRARFGRPRGLRLGVRRARCTRTSSTGWRAAS